MSFSFSASGTPREAIRSVGQQAAANPQCPQHFADAVNEQLGLLPGDASVSVTCHGHTGWGSAQQRGQITLGCVIDVVAGTHPSTTE